MTWSASAGRRCRGPARAVGATSDQGSSAVPSIRLSSGAPRLPRTVIRLEVRSSSRSNFATMDAVVSSEDSTSSLRPGASSRRSASMSRPTRVTTSDDSADQCIRARARATDDTAGSTSTSSPSRSSRVVPIPEISGSPEASATSGRSPYSASRAGSPDSGRGHARRAWPSTGGTRPRCRSPPSTTSAARIRARVASGSPAQPSAPMPTTVITRPTSVSRPPRRQ